MMPPFNDAMVIRQGLKLLSLLFLIGAPLWAVVTLSLGFLLGPAPDGAAEVGAMLDDLWDKLLPSLLSGGVLWLLLGIDERLRRLEQKGGA